MKDRLQLKYRIDGILGLHIKKTELSIITAEDPVEHVMEGITQCSINPDVNLPYDETLRRLERQDPDVFVLGYVPRDIVRYPGMPETGVALLEIAL